MQKLLLAALAAGTVMTVATPAMAREGCGPGWHRGAYDRCVPNRGPRGPYGPGVAVVPGGPALVIGNFYEGRGYWDGHRYWRHREHWHGGWRYR
ncbi:MAG: hypothetical protein KGJ57_10785 [Sphingomonadales bacterium]|nr:hypothetical protein [Sphingomonadales bacterium]MDE2169899.1 hypothetical protein [Sphingomonadales bacterium]